LKKKEEWVDFGLKIKYIYEVLFEHDKEKLINYFSAPADLNNRISRMNRKKTIENWLKGLIKNPYSFKLSDFKISEYKYPNGEALFSMEAFIKLDIVNFRKIVDNYIEVLKRKEIKANRLQYIYYYHFNDRINDRIIDYYTITYPDPDNLSIVHLKSSQLKDEMTYKGEIIEYHNMLYIFVKNNFDYMIYIVENSANIFIEKIKVYGTGQCKDYTTRQPKVYLALFSSIKLTPLEEEKFKHKLNNSNLLIARSFPKTCVLPQDYMFHNFYQKINSLWKDILEYENMDVINGEYYDILINEFKSYIQIIKKSSQNFDFFISTHRKLKIYSLTNLLNNELETGIIIVYTLNSVSLPYLYKIILNQIEFLDILNVYLKYIIVVEEKEAITSSLISKLKELESKNVDIKLSSKNPTKYSEIFITIDTNLSLYRIGSDIDDYTFVTNRARKINELHQAYDTIETYSLSLSNFLDTQCKLNGKWICYSYGSKYDNSFYHSVPIEIQNNNVMAIYSTGVSIGKIYKTKQQTLLILEDTIIKIHNHNIYDNIFKVSIIGKELYIEHRDLLVYGIMSKEALKPEEVHLLLDSIHIKEDYHFRLKTSDSFDRILAEFKAKKFK